MTDTPKPPQPISVRPHAAPIIGEEAFKTLVVAGFAYLAANIERSQLALAAMLPAGAIAATCVWAVLKRLETWRALKFLTAYVGDDSVATTG